MFLLLLITFPYFFFISLTPLPTKFLINNPAYENIVKFIISLFNNNEEVEISFEFQNNELETITINLEDIKEFKKNFSFINHETNPTLFLLYFFSYKFRGMIGNKILMKYFPLNNEHRTINLQDKNLIKLVEKNDPKFDENKIYNDNQITVLEKILTNKSEFNKQLESAKKAIDSCTVSHTINFFLLNINENNKPFAIKNIPCNSLPRLIISAYMKDLEDPKKNKLAFFIYKYEVIAKNLYYIYIIPRINPNTSTQGFAQQLTPSTIKINRGKYILNELINETLSKNKKQKVTLKTNKAKMIINLEDLFPFMFHNS